MNTQDQASKDRALQALSSMSSAQIVSATAVQPVHGSTNCGRSVLPSVLYPHMSPLGASQYPGTYASSGGVVGHRSLQVTACSTSPMHVVLHWVIVYCCLYYLPM